MFLGQNSLLPIVHICTFILEMFVRTLLSLILILLIHCLASSKFSLMKAYYKLYMSHLVRKPTICICENKGADQLRSNCEADQRLCFRYTDSTLPLLLKSKISSFWPAPVTVQVGLCLTCWETTLLVFPRDSSYIDCKQVYSDSSIQELANNLKIVKSRNKGHCNENTKYPNIQYSGSNDPIPTRSKKLLPC